MGNYVMLFQGAPACSDYTGDSNTRISVTGFCVFLMEVSINWKCKAQRKITLFSSEAEFVALSEAAKKIKFIIQVLLSIGIKFELAYLYWKMSVVFSWQ